MFRSLIAIILSLLVITPLSANDWSAVVSKLEKSIVYIETDDGACTGFVIDTVRKYVQTAAHCDGEKLWVDRVEGKVISKDTQKDLLILEVKNLDPERVALKLSGKDPAIGDEVMSAGYGYALERPFFRKANISDNGVMIPSVGGPFIGVDSGFIGGQSGGPVVNRSGEVVAIVQMASDKLGIGVSAEVLKARVGRFYEK